MSDTITRRRTRRPGQTDPKSGSHPSQIVQNGGMKQGTTPASGGGSPGPRQTPPQPKAGHKATRPTSKPAQTSRQPAARHPLPPPPEGLSWPRPRLPGVLEADRTDDDYDRAEECGQPGGLKRYLERVWGETRLQHIDMPTLREHWPRLGEAIDRQRRQLAAKQMKLPALKPELTNRVATEIPKRDRPWHVEKALQMRAYRARRKVREAEA
jgi:hypothetical protein